MPSHINVITVYELMQSQFLLSMVDFLWIDDHTVGLLAAPYPISNAIYCMLIRIKNTNRNTQNVYTLRQHYGLYELWFLYAWDTGIL